MKWVQQQQDEITSMVREVREAIQKRKPKVQLSAALMPEGGEKDDAFALCNYAQNYREIGKYLDFICPMSYEGSFQQIGLGGGYRQACRRTNRETGLCGHSRILR